MSHTTSARKLAQSAALKARIDETLSRAHRVNARVNCFSTIDDDASNRPNGRTEPTQNLVPSTGPLSGVMVSVKDSLHVPGLARWHGSATHPGTISTTASVPVERLTRAGAIIIGKTSMPDYGLLASGLSSQFGVIRNPWDPRVSPGGSSSGAGASVSAGVTESALGTDIAGSVRLPAAHCGVTALKPTQGTLAYAPASTWRSAGPISRRVTGVRSVYQALTGPSAADQLSARTDSPQGGAVSTPSWEPSPALLHGLKVGVLEWPGYGPTMDGDTSTLFDHALALMGEHGASLSDVNPRITTDDFYALDRCLMARCLAELETCPDELRHYLLPQVLEWSRPGRNHSASDFYRDFEHLSSTASRLNVVFDAFDVVVSPVMGVHWFPAEDFGPDIGKPLLYHTNYTAWFNQTGQPAVSLPMGLSTRGLPVGLQIAGRRFDDFALLDIAEAIERILDVQLDYPVL